MLFQVGAGSVVRVVWMSEELSGTFEGQVVSSDEHAMKVKLSSNAVTAVGLRCVICLDQPEDVKISARVQSIEPDGVVFALGTAHRMRRQYNRVDAHLPVDYRLGNATADVEDWLPAASPVVNFSADGLAFLTDLDIPLGQQVALRMTIPAPAEQQVTLEGQVIRVTQEVNDDGDSVHLVAVHLSEVEPDVHELLLDFTLECQKQALAELEPTH